MGDELAASFAQGMGPGDRLYLPDPVYQGGTVERTRGSDWLAQARCKNKGRWPITFPNAGRSAKPFLRKRKTAIAFSSWALADDSLSEFARDLVEGLGSRN